MKNDLTHGSPLKVLLMFSLPMLIGNVVQQFYNMVDLIVVGRYVGVTALAAVGATGSTMFFMFSMVAGLTNGASVVVSQYFGYGDQQKTRTAVATAVTVLGVAGVAITVVGVFITRPVLVLLKTPPEILEQAVDYLWVICLGILATVAYNASAAIIRALGDSVTPLVFLIVAAALNILLDIWFVVGFGMGVAGAAWATVLAQALSAVACIVYAVKKIPILRLSRADFKLDGLILRQTVRLGVPGGIQNSLIAIGSMAVQSVVNTFGPVYVAAFAAATKLDQFAVQPLLSLSMACATFTAQNMGAGRIDRVKRGFWSAIAMSSVFSVAVTAVLYLFGGNLMTLFVDAAETQVLEVGVQYLQIVSVFYVVLGVIIMEENMLRGAGDVMIPVFSNALEIVVRIVGANMLAAAFGYAGVCWVSPISWCVGTVICSIRFFTGGWQTKALVSGGERQYTEQPDAEGTI